MTINFKELNGCFISKRPFFFYILAFVLLSCSNQEEIHRDYKVLFEVNSVERTVFDFESEYVAHLIQTGQNDSKERRYAFINQMIDEILLAEEASKNGFLDHPTYLSALNFQQRKSMMDFYFVDEMDSLIAPPTDEELRLAYDKKHRKVYVRQLFSMFEDDLAEPLQRLKDGEYFVDVANDFYETESYDSLAGYLGPISYFGVDDAFAEAAFSTYQGDFTEPIRSKFGFHIIYIEYIEFPAMLAEDDYQYRIEGLTSQVRLRNQQVVSNDYVRNLMGSLLVEGNNENLSSLMAVIKDIDSEQIVNTQQSQESPVERWGDRRLDELRASYPNDAILATYVFGDNRIDFTFDDYLNWLPYLSFVESKNRTGASVGRALRNEVLYKIAQSNGYADDKRVKERVEKRGYEILSELYQYDLTMEALADTSEIEVPRLFRNRLIDSKEITLQVEYWRIPASTLQRAEEIKEAIVSGVAPNSFENYEENDFATIEKTDNNYSLLDRSLLNTPVLAHSSEDGWMVLNVSKRNIELVSTTTSVDDLETRYKVYDKLLTEISSLRLTAEIAVDSVLFDDIYELWKQKDTEEKPLN